MEVGPIACFENVVEAVVCLVHRLVGEVEVVVSLRDLMMVRVRGRWRRR